MKKSDFGEMAQQLKLTPQPVVDAIEDLNEWVCLHFKFKLLLQTILNAINGRSRDLLIVVLGPARVGKTTLFEVIAGILDELAKQAGRSRGCFRFSVPSPNKLGRFDWKAAITRAYVSAGEILPFKKIMYPDITEGAPRYKPGVADEDALWESFVKNIRLEKLVTLVDEGNTIPVTLSDLQVTRAIHSLKDIVAQTRQPLLIFGTSAVRHIVEHDTQLKVRTKMLRFDVYEDLEVDLKSFATFIGEMEKRLGPEFCVPGSLSPHAAEIRRGTDGRSGLVVRVATDALSQHGHEKRLDWDLYKKFLDELAASSGADLAEERRVTNKPIIAAAEVPLARGKTKSEKVERNGRVGATKNTNVRNHPFS